MVHETEEGSWAVWDGSHYRMTGLDKRRAIEERRNDELIVPQKYLVETRPIGEARAVATIELERLVRSALELTEARLSFGPTEFVGEGPMWWLFRRYCSEWQADGLVPGAVSCVVDKADLHVWSEAETEAFRRSYETPGVSAPVLRATTSNGETSDDPSDDHLFLLFEDTARGDVQFFVVERLADRSGQTYIQAIQDGAGGWIVERREGSPDEHFSAAFGDMRSAHTAVTSWAYELPLPSGISWDRVPPL